MKKTAAIPSVKKKEKKPARPHVKTPLSKSAPVPKKENKEIPLLLSRLKEDLLAKMDLKFNSLNHRFDRIEDGIGEILDELRESETLLDSTAEPYEGQA